jgi:hypothetical protein
MSAVGADEGRRTVDEGRRTVGKHDAGHGKRGDRRTMSGTFERLDEAQRTGPAPDGERVRSRQEGADPDRLSETGSNDPGAALLRSAGRYKISDATRQRALAVVGPGAGVKAPATAGSAAEDLTAETDVLGSQPSVETDPTAAGIVDLANQVVPEAGPGIGTEEQPPAVDAAAAPSVIAIPPTPQDPVMAILQALSDGAISVEEADHLLESHISPRSVSSD